MRNVRSLGAALFAAAATGLSSPNSVAQEESSTFVQADHILLRTEEAAKMAMSLLDKGTDFSWLAARWSLDEASAIKGGQLPVALCSQYVPEFSQSACSVELFKPAVVKTVFGWHVLRVKSRGAKQELVKGEDSRLDAPPFSPTLSFVCRTSADDTKPLVVRVDEVQRISTLNGSRALVSWNELFFEMWLSGLDKVSIDRTTGGLTVYPLGGSPISGWMCTSTAKRIF